MVATFDPPPASMKDAIGHYCLDTLNLSAKQFEFLDSINGPESEHGSIVFRKMLRTSKKSGKTAAQAVMIR